MNDIHQALVPEAGIEPARHCCHWFLRPTRLPIPPLGQTHGKFKKMFVAAQKNITFKS